MIPKEREKLLYQLLSEGNDRTLSSLAKRMFVSEMTLRRDLATLLQLGEVKLTRGVVETVEPNFSSHCARVGVGLVSDVDEKRAAAEKALAFIGSGDTVYLDPCSAAVFLAELIKDRTDVTVVTDSLRVINVLVTGCVRFYALGGLCFRNADSIRFNADAFAAMKHLHIDAAFFSGNGIVPHDAVYDTNPLENENRKAFLARSRRRYFLCSTPKIGYKAPFRICGTDELTDVIYGGKGSYEDVYTAMKAREAR